MTLVQKACIGIFFFKKKHIYIHIYLFIFCSIILIYKDLPERFDKSDRAEKSFDRIMRQNTKIIEKIELVLTSNKAIENRLIKIEKQLDNKSNHHDLDEKAV